LNILEDYSIGGLLFIIFNKLQCHSKRKLGELGYRREKNKISSNYSTFYVICMLQFFFQVQEYTMALKMIAVPLVCLMIVVSVMDAASIKSMTCPGTTASSNCINTECSIISADGTKKELTCPPGQTGITNTDGKTTVVTCQEPKKIEMPNCFPCCT
jgi:hypothetical protein